MNLIQRARKAVGLTQAELARLLGTKQQIISRWERGGKMSAPAVALLTVVEREPEAVLRALRAGNEPGFAGDGGPPPVRSRGQNRPVVDEFGFTDVEGPAPEADIGWAPGDDLGVAGFSPEFDAPPE